MDDEVGAPRRGQWRRRDPAQPDFKLLGRAAIGGREGVADDAGSAASRDHKVHAGNPEHRRRDQRQAQAGAECREISHLPSSAQPGLWSHLRPQHVGGGYDRALDRPASACRCATAPHTTWHSTRRPFSSYHVPSAGEEHGGVCVCVCVSGGVSVCAVTCPGSPARSCADQRPRTSPAPPSGSACGRRRRSRSWPVTTARRSSP